MEQNKIIKEESQDVGIIINRFMRRITDFCKRAIKDGEENLLPFEYDYISELGRTLLLLNIIQSKYKMKRDGEWDEDIDQPAIDMANDGMENFLA